MNARDKEPARPPGYQSLEPLDRDRHGGLGVDAARGYAFAAGLNAVFLTIMEFFRAQRDYPIVFSRDDASGEYLPLALTGLEPGQNLFVDGEGRWTPDRYVPAYVRRYPFYTVDVARPGEPVRHAIFVDPSGLSPDAPPLFDAEGQDAEAWKQREALINEMQGAIDQTRRFTRLLADRGLLEPFTAHTAPKHGKALKLQGLYRIEETRLNALAGDDIKEMMKDGMLSRCYAHLMSLENFALLMQLQQEQQPA